ncbi:MAG: (2Fe-2S)-binding protein [Chloroflexi bacterium]|nr:(2Fe-2S)-binding protein [Chloroflexota bacterium]
MPKVTIEPLGQSIEAEVGASIMEAAWSHGLYWPTTCGGQGICTSCACSVEAGDENLEPMGRSEMKTLREELGEATIRSRRLRLACQARIRGDVTVTKQGVRPARPSALTLE